MKSLGEYRHLMTARTLHLPLQASGLCFLLQGAHACVKLREGQGHDLFILSCHLIFHIMFGWRMPIHRYVTSLAFLRILFLIYKLFPTISQIFPLNTKVSVWRHPKSTHWKPYQHQAISQRPVRQLCILPGGLQAWAQDPVHQHIWSKWRDGHSSRGWFMAPSTPFKPCFHILHFLTRKPSFQCKHFPH